jgi:ribonuclease HI
LNTIQTTGLRLCTGAFRTSPASSLTCVTGQMPLNLRRERFTLQYFLHVLSTAKHSNLSLFSKQSLVYKYQQKSSSTKPLFVRAYELIDCLDINIPKFFKNSFSSIPPWSVSPPVIDFSLTVHRKKDLHILQVKHLYLELMNQYLGHVKIFTDGSKTKSGVGCSVFVDNECKSWSLSPDCSIYTAELYAVWRALQHCQQSLTSDSFVVLSDSLSVLQALENVFSDDPLVQLVLSTLHSVRLLNKSVSFIWIPSHSGIVGNDQADKSAVLAANQLKINENCIRPLDIKNIIKISLKTVWLQNWTKTSSKLQSYKRNVDPLHLPSSLSRHESCVITRLLIGHSRLTHQHLLLRTPPPVCLHCHVSLTVHHILFICTLYHHRHQHHLHEDMFFTHTFGPGECQNLISFLKSTSLFCQL